MSEDQDIIVNRRLLMLAVATLAGVIIVSIILAKIYGGST